MLFQAPALVFYNDAVFTEDDWKGIRKINDSIKVHYVLCMLHNYAEPDRATSAVLSVIRTSEQNMLRVSCCDWPLSVDYLHLPWC